MAIATTAVAGSGLISVSQGPPSLACQVVQSAEAQGSAVTSLAPFFTGAQSSGNANCVAIGVSVAGTITSVTDSTGINLYTLVASIVNGTQNLYVYACAGGLAAIDGVSAGGIITWPANNTVTVAFSAPVSASATIVEVEGVQGCDFNVVTASGTTTGSTASLVAQMPASLVITAAIGNATAAPTAGAGFTAQQTGSDGVAFSFILETQSVSAVGGSTVTCAATGVAAAVAGAWSTAAIAFWPTNTLPIIDMTVCFFCNTKTHEVSTLFQIVGSVTQGHEINSTAAGAVGFYFPGFGTANIAGPTVTVGIWYFFALTLRTAVVGGNPTSYAALYWKVVGEPTCKVGFANNNNGQNFYQPTNYCVGVEQNISTTNVLATQDQECAVSFAGVKIWRQQLTQAQLEQESRQIAPAMRAGLFALWSLNDKSTLTSNGAPGVQLAPFNSADVSTVAGPDIPLYWSPPLHLSPLLEDASSRVAEALVSDPVTLTSAVEDFAATSVPSFSGEETSTWTVTFAPDALPVQSLPSEEIATRSTPLTEEVASVIAVATEQTALQVYSGEDFAESLPLEESVATQWSLVEPTWITLKFDVEDFAGIHLVEEQGTLPPPQPVDPASVVLSSQEDFAGSLPLEESVTTQWSLVEPTWITLKFDGENFSGVHLVEEQGALSPPQSVDPASVVMSSQEDYAGSLPLEESAVVLPLGEDPTAWYASSVMEDFAGSRAYEEESSIFRWDAAGDCWQVYSISEDFAGSLPLEEDAVYSWSVRDQPVWQTYSVAEDFAGSLSLEEDGAPAQFVSVEVSALAFSFGEEFVSALAAIDEDSALLTPDFASVAWRTLEFQGEDFASSSLPVEEDSPTLPTLLYAPPAYALHSVSEEWTLVPTPPKQRRHRPVISGGGLYRPPVYDPLDDTFKQGGRTVSWQDVSDLESLSYSGVVDFRTFENKLALEDKRRRGEAVFREGVQTALRHSERMRLIKTTVTVAGIAYVVWRLLI